MVAAGSRAMTWQAKLMDIEYYAEQRGREEEFLSTIRALHDAGQSLAFMERITRRSKDEVINGLHSLNLSIPS